MSGAILVKRTSAGPLPVNAPAGDAGVGTLSPYYIQGPKYDLGSAMSGVIAINLTDQDIIRNQFGGTLAGNVSIGFTNPPAPMTWQIHLKQSAAGDCGVSWQEGIKWLNTLSPPAMPEYANEEAVYSFCFDGADITATMAYKGYPTRKHLLLPHAHGISWSQGGAWNSNCNIVGGAEAGNPDGTFVPLNRIVHNATGGHVFYSQLYLENGSQTWLLRLGAQATSLVTAGNPTACIAVGGGGHAPSAAAPGAFLVWAAQIGGNDQCPHILTANNKLIRLFQGSKIAYNGGGEWTTATLAQLLRDIGFLDTA